MQAKAPEVRDLREHLTDANQNVHAEIVSSKETDVGFDVVVETDDGTQYEASVISKHGRSPKKGEYWNFIAGEKLAEPEEVTNEKGEVVKTYKFGSPVADFMN